MSKEFLMKKTALVIEAEPETRELLRGLLEKTGLEVFVARSASEGLNFAKSQSPNFVLMNLYLNAPEIDDSGLELLGQLRSETNNLPVVVMGRVVDLERIRAVMRLGAYDYLPIPFSPETLFPSVKNLLEHQSLKVEVERLRKEVNEQYNLNGLISRSPKMSRIVQLIPQIANSESHVLILGESGTGKEIIAKAIHYNSPRRDGPFIALNCGAMPESLAESELFGHEKGSFTGAMTTQKGKLELAYSGTLFLDEVGEMPLSIQIKLLRVLDEQKFMRVGGSKHLEMNAKIITATNRELEKAVNLGEFRQDLFYRLNVIQIRVPPLRERREDIPILVNYFLKELTGVKKRLAADIMEYLIKQPWKGNVRELRNAMERAVVISNKKEIQLEDFLLTFAETENLNLKDDNQSAEEILEEFLQILTRQKCDKERFDLLEIAEEAVIQAAVAKMKGNKSKAANLLGIDRKKVERRMAKYRIIGQLPRPKGRGL